MKLLSHTNELTYSRIGDTLVFLVIINCSLFFIQQPLKILISAMVEVCMNENYSVMKMCTLQCAVFCLHVMETLIHVSCQYKVNNWNDDGHQHKLCFVTNMKMESPALMGHILFFYLHKVLVVTWISMTKIKSQCLTFICVGDLTWVSVTKMRLQSIPQTFCM
jgi:hypothetical protein